jgi:hypothetical protein
LVFFINNAGDLLRFWPELTGNGIGARTQWIDPNPQSTDAGEQMIGALTHLAGAYSHRIDESTKWIDPDLQLTDADAQMIGALTHLAGAYSHRIDESTQWIDPNLQLKLPLNEFTNLNQKPCEMELP